MRLTSLSASPQNIKDGSRLSATVHTAEANGGHLVEFYISPTPRHDTDRAVKVAETTCPNQVCEIEIDISADELASALSTAMTLSEQLATEGLPISGLGMGKVKALWLIAYCPDQDDGVVVQINYIADPTSFWTVGGFSMSTERETALNDVQNYSSTTISANLAAPVLSTPEPPESMVGKVTSKRLIVVLLVLGLLVVGIFWSQNK